MAVLGSLDPPSHHFIDRTRLRYTITQPINIIGNHEQSTAAMDKRSA